MPGKQNPFADATSRHPSQADSDEDTEEPASVTEILAGLRILEMMAEEPDNTMEIASAMLDLKKTQTVSWDRVKSATLVDTQLSLLSGYIRYGFPDSRHEVEEVIHDFWQYRQELSLSDSVIV